MIKVNLQDCSSENACIATTRVFMVQIVYMKEPSAACRYLPKLRSKINLILRFLVELVLKQLHRKVCSRSKRAHTVKVFLKCYRGQILSVCCCGNRRVPLKLSNFIFSH